MDRSRPLWDMHVIEGLEGGLMAVIARTHHAAIDGRSGVDITVNLLDLDPEPAPVPPPETPWEPDRIPTDLELVSYAASSLARQPVSAAKAARRGVETALTLRRATASPTSTRRRRRSPRLARRSTGPSRLAGRSAWPRSRSTTSSRCARSSAGRSTTSSWPCARGAAPVVRRPRRGARPVARRHVPHLDPHRGPAGTLGNQVSSMLTTLATDVDDPLERLAAIKDGTRHAKDQAGAIGAEVLTSGPSSPPRRWRPAPPGSTPGRGWPRATARSTT
jgi:hypothetical protein